jgi:hypothetical protein
VPGQPQENAELTNTMATLGEDMVQEDLEYGQQKKRVCVRVCVSEVGKMTRSGRAQLTLDTGQLEIFYYTQL